MSDDNSLGLPPPQIVAAPPTTTSTEDEQASQDVTESLIAAVPVPPPVDDVEDDTGKKPRKKNRTPKAQRGKDWRRGRAPRRPEEDIMGDDYVERMFKLGARDGESRLSFVTRMAALEAGRALILDMAHRCHGNLSDLAKILGVNRHNLGHHLRQAGLTTQDIKALRPEGLKREPGPKAKPTGTEV